MPDIKRTAAYHESVLGFRRVDYLDVVEPHICLYRDDVELILLQSKTEAVRPNRELYGYGYEANIYTKDLDELQYELMERGAVIVKPLQITEYGNQEFVVEDIDSRWLAFGVKAKAENLLSAARKAIQKKPLNDHWKGAQ